MKRRDFLTALLASPFIAKLDLPAIKAAKRPTIAALQKIADIYMAPKIADDLAYHFPECSDVRVRVYPDPNSPGYLVKAIWRYGANRFAKAGSLMDFGQEPTVEDIVGQISGTRSHLTLKALDFLKKEG